MKYKYSLKNLKYNKQCKSQMLINKQLNDLFSYY